MRIRVVLVRVRSRLVCAGQPVSWFVSEGHEPEGRTSGVERAREARCIRRSECGGANAQSQLGAPAMLISQAIPNLSTHMPKVSPQIAFSSGMVMVPPSMSFSQ